MIWRLCWLLACAGGLCGTAAAEVPATPQPRQLTVADGLPSSNINAFAEDKMGYLWLASRDGLARYDGRNYRIWRAEDGLRDNLVWSLHVDARNQLWIGTQNMGLAMLSADRRSFRFFNHQTHPEIGSNTVWSVASTPDGSVWFGTATGGLHRLSPEGQITRFMPEPGNPRSLPAAAVGYLAVTRDGNLWVGTKGGLARWRGDGFEPVDERLLPSSRINGLEVDREGRMWVATNGGVVVRSAEGHFAPAQWPGAPPGEVLNVLQYSSDGNYWLDTRTGLGRFRNSTVRNVPLFSAQERGLVRPNWSSAFEDREGGLWFASTNAGLWHLPPSWRQFSVLSRLVDDPQSLRNPYPLAMAPSLSGGVWVVGTRGALDRFDPATGAVEHHLTVIDDKNWPQSLAEDPQGRVWIGSLDGLVRYDPRDRSVRRWRHTDTQDPAMPGDADILRVCDGGRLWVYSEIAGLQLRDGEGRVQLQLPIGQAGVPATTIEDMQCGPGDHLWLASGTGLLLWQPQGQRFAPVPGSPGSRVSTFALSDSGVAWVAGQGRVDRLLWNGQSLSPLDSISGRDFPMLAPNGLVIDSDGVAWASSARGLIRIDPGSRSVRLYGVHDGLPGQEFRRRSLVQARSGQVAGGTPEGVVLFEPGLVKPSSRQPPLVVERVSVRRGDQEQELTNQTPLLIREGDRDLRIVARLLSFADSATNSYRFRLGGYDPDWVEAGANGERVFSRLPPGNYQLEIQAATSDNVWSAVRTLAFQVQPPWWRSAPGMMSLIVFGVAVLLWGAWLYRRRLRRRSEWQLALHKQELAEQASLAKTRFLATLGHEVRTPMTGVLGMSELLAATELDERQRNYTQSIRRAGEHLLRLVNDALDLARIEAGKLELQSQPLELQQLLDDVRGLMEPLAQRRGLDFQLDNQAPARTRVVGDAMRLRQILLNLLGNAIKFTSDGHVGLRIGLEPGGRGVWLEVSDTGPGISPEQRKRLFRRFEQADGARTTARYGGSGLGLAICHELAMAMGGSIDVDSALGEGTAFTVRLPLAWEVGSRSAEDEAAAAWASLPPQRVLLVEDDPTIAAVIRGLLEVHGHQVSHAAHGLAALAEVSASEFDVALLDLDLPGLDGIGLARQLQTMGYDMPLVAVTARSDADAEPTARAAGFADFLRKPVTAQMLLESIAAVLAAQRRRREGLV
ncbi:hybrid sensor histidine kinase/response regulator [Stenotrophomonas sp. UBA7606]|uniref:hybrid sensor histidine kinase/response regulator n=1 Tax=Stenotrophomonas sp. UBA7606 TaxID=1947559 RepID=UPI0026007F07|nr:hybrid sensor histidine kinase/response regulator [Stenotrophomonas sp. UBA7606]